MTRLQTKLLRRLKDQHDGVEKMIDARDGSYDWDEKTRTTHGIALDLAIQTLDLLRRLLEKELLEK